MAAHIADAIKGISFSPLTADPAVYTHLMGDDPDSIVFTHVDNSLCLGPPSRGQAATRDILQLFPGRDLSEITTFALGLHISHNWDDDTITISQEKLVGEALACFGMLSCAPCPNPLPDGGTLTFVTAHTPLNPG
jgi:hypothetical protein